MTKYYLKEVFDKKTNSIAMTFIRLPKDFKGRFKVPNGVEVIGKRAFANCKELTIVVLPSSVKVIYDEAFENSGLKKIVIPEGVEVIARRMFSNCKRLAVVSLPSHLAKIEKEAFSGCTSLTDVHLPESLTEIGSGAFSHCNLNQIEVGSNVMSIGRGAFSNNDAEFVRIGASTCFIGERAFWMNDPRTIVVDVDNRTYCDGGYNVIMEKGSGKVVFRGSRKVPDEALDFAKNCS